MVVRLRKCFILTFNEYRSVERIKTLLLRRRIKRVGRLGRRGTRRVEGVEGPGICGRRLLHGGTVEGVEAIGGRRLLWLCLGGLALHGVEDVSKLIRHFWLGLDFRLLRHLRLLHHRHHLLLQLLELLHHRHLLLLRVLWIGSHLGHLVLHLLHLHLEHLLRICLRLLVLLLLVLGRWHHGLEV